MDLLTPYMLALTIPAVIFAGISKGGFGSGVAFASASILAVAMEPIVAIGLMLPLLMLIDLRSLPAYWKGWDWPSANVLMLGSIPGVLLGAVFFARADADSLRLMIGGLSLGFVAWQSLHSLGMIRLGQKRASTGTGLVAGLALGFTSFVSHAGGPVAAVYLLGQRLDKTTYQATTVLVFGAVNLMKLVFYGGMGVFTRETLLLDLALAPFAIFGTWLGIRAHFLVPERVFFGVTYVALTITGVKLIWDALT